MTFWRKCFRSYNFSETAVDFFAEQAGVGEQAFGVLVATFVAVAVFAPVLQEVPVMLQIFCNKGEQQVVAFSGVATA